MVDTLPSRLNDPVTVTETCGACSTIAAVMFDLPPAPALWQSAVGCCDSGSDTVVFDATAVKTAAAGLFAATCTSFL